MTTNQISALVNNISSIALGRSALTTVDAGSLVSLGSAVLSSQDNAEAFMNTLLQRIGRTIVRFRSYRNKFSDQIIGDMEWGAILQKLNVSVGDAVDDVAWDLTDGQSVDQWIVKKPTVSQKLFVGRNPYTFYITIPYNQLREAFLSAEAMQAFISSIYGKVQNKLEFSAENLARTTLATAIANTRAAQRINLNAAFTAARGGGSTGITEGNYTTNEGFLRFCVRMINATARKMTDMTTLYNDGTVDTFTPYDDMKIRVIADFQEALETYVQYNAFNKELVELNAFSELNYWQSPQTPYKVDIEDATGTAFTQDNIVAVIHDRDAWGLYQQNTDVLSTGLNARGKYTNYFYHNMRNYMIDTSENFVVFYVDAAT